MMLRRLALARMRRPWRLRQRRLFMRRMALLAVRSDIERASAAHCIFAVGVSGASGGVHRGDTDVASCMVRAREAIAKLLAGKEASPASLDRALLFEQV